jgi:hypothetical protein
VAELLWLERAVEHGDARPDHRATLLEDQAVDLGQQRVGQLAPPDDQMSRPSSALSARTVSSGSADTSSTAGSGLWSMVVENTRWRRCR